MIDATATDEMLLADLVLCIEEIKQPTPKFESSSRTVNAPTVDAQDQGEAPVDGN